MNLPTTLRVGLLGLLCCAGLRGATDILVNGDFEADVLPSNTYQTFLNGNSITG